MTIQTKLFNLAQFSRRILRTVPIKCECWELGEEPCDPEDNFVCPYCHRELPHCLSKVGYGVHQGCDDCLLSRFETGNEELFV